MVSTLELFLPIIAMATAFLIGFAIRRGSICLVAATQDWVVAGKSMRIRAFAVAAAASGMLILPVAWFSPIENALVQTHAINGSLLLGAMGFGVGALINGGCAFGTLARLSGGQVAYAGTITASAGTALLVSDLAKPEVASEPIFFDPLPIGIVAFLLFLFAARPVFQRRHHKSIARALVKRGAPLRPLTAMLVIGALGGLLYALAGSWTHLGVIGQEARFYSGISMDEPAGKALAGGLSLIAGALFAAWHSGKFRWRWGDPKLWLRCVIGGGLMGASAAFIPGGNGALIVHGVPSGALHAWVAIAVIVATLAGAFLMMRRFMPS